MTRNQNLYCSVACRAAAAVLPDVECPTCRTMFHPKGGRRFCSPECAWKAQTAPDKQCEECRQPFHPKANGIRFCSRACAAKGTGRQRRTGQVKVNARGYRVLYLPEHPMASKTGMILEHRMVMAEVLGRMLTPDEVVHHRNEDKQDNRPENLEVLPKRVHDRLPKPPPKPKLMECPHCANPILVRGRGVRSVEVP